MENMKKDMRFICKEVGVRTYGSDEEKKVAEYTKEGFKNSGLSAEIQEFPVEKMVYSSVEFGKVENGQIKKLEVLPLPQSGVSENPEGEILELAYLENVKLAPKRANEIKNKAVIVYGGLGGNLQEFRALMNSGAKAIIMNDGRYPVPWLIASGMPYLWMKEKMLPVVTPKYFDTVDLLKEGVKEVFVKVVGKKKKFVSQNVVGFKKGRSKKNIVVTAHHDSVMVGEGATDNATGVAILLEISRRLEKIPQQEKGVYLVSFGSEEVLSYGALNFVKENEEVVENSVFAINFDSCSSFYGENKILITGEDKLTSYIEKEVDRSGKWFNLSSDTSPFSDHFPFNVKGVPSIWFRRHNSSQGYFPFHSHLNQLEIVDFNVMEEVVDISFKMICELADIPEMPFPREISSQNKEKISYYHKELCGSMLDK